MKAYKIIGPATLAFATALVASNASAVPTGNLLTDVASAVGGDGRVSVCVDGNTVTLSGYVENAMVAHRARRAALENEEIDEVIDLISRS